MMRARAYHVLPVGHHQGAKDLEVGNAFVRPRLAWDHRALLARVTPCIKYLLDLLLCDERAVREGGSQEIRDVCRPELPVMRVRAQLGIDARELRTGPERALRRKRTSHEGERRR